MLDIKIKKLNIDDINIREEELKYLLKVILASGDGMPDIEFAVEKYFSDMRSFLRDGSAIIIGAFFKKQLIGLHWGYEFDWGCEKRIHSYFIGVREEYQKEKIGTLLQNALENVARDKNINVIDTTCEKSNDISYKYHLKQGYQIESYRMVKRLK